MELELAVRRKITGAMVAKHAKACRAEKAAILGQLCELNGLYDMERGDRPRIRVVR